MLEGGTEVKEDNGRTGMDEKEVGRQTGRGE